MPSTTWYDSLAVALIDETSTEVIAALPLAAASVAMFSTSSPVLTASSSAVKMTDDASNAPPSPPSSSDPAMVVSVSAVTVISKSITAPPPPSSSWRCAASFAPDSRRRESVHVVWPMSSASTPSSVAAIAAMSTASSAAVSARGARASGAGLTDAVANARRVARAHAQEAHCMPASVTEADTTMGTGGV